MCKPGYSLKDIDTTAFELDMGEDTKAFITRMRLKSAYYDLLPFYVDGAKRLHPDDPTKVYKTMASYLQFGRYSGYLSFREYRLGELWANTWILENKS